MNRGQYSQEIKAMAPKLGMTHLGKGNRTFAQQSFQQAELFQRGDVRGFHDIVHGTYDGRELYVIGYFYRGGGLYSGPFVMTVCALRCPATLPQFTLEPESIVHKIASRFGFQDIDLDDHPRFSKSYLLRGSDPESITKRFRGPIAESLGKNPGWTIACTEGWLILGQLGEHVVPSQIEQWFNQVFRVANLFAE